jgi:hypothetical protein
LRATGPTGTPSDGPSPLLALLRDPTVARRLSLTEWDLIVRQGRRAGLLGTVATRLADHGLADSVPAAARPHLESAKRLAARHALGVRWEIECLARALRSTAVPIVLLKGAAYAAAELPISRGRTFVDIDVMVPKATLQRTEMALALHGWLPSKMTAYDKRYYREWMHEIPPLRHIKRGSVLDVHHTILPPTSKPRPDASKLLLAAVPVTELEEIYVLAPADMVLHSATHLFYDGELNHGLRDLVDLDDLVRDFGEKDPGFWQALVDRAFEMELAQPLFYGLRYAWRFLGTPVPEFVQEAIARAGPSRLMRPVMDALFDRALMPDHATCSDWLTPTARWLLYVRAHYLRMPMRLLIPHLTRKAWRRVKGEEAH